MTKFLVTTRYPNTEFIEGNITKCEAFICESYASVLDVLSKIEQRYKNSYYSLDAQVFVIADSAEVSYKTIPIIELDETFINKYGA